MEKLADCVGGVLDRGVARFVHGAVADADDQLGLGKDRLAGAFLKARLVDQRRDAVVIGKVQPAVVLVGPLHGEFDRAPGIEGRRARVTGNVAFRPLRIVEDLRKFGGEEGEVGHASTLQSKEVFRERGADRLPEFRIDVVPPFDGVEHSVANVLKVSGQLLFHCADDVAQWHVPYHELFAQHLVFMVEFAGLFNLGIDRAVRDELERAALLGRDTLVRQMFAKGVLGLGGAQMLSHADIGRRSVRARIVAGATDIDELFAGRSHDAPGIEPEPAPEHLGRQSQLVGADCHVGSELAGEGAVLKGREQCFGALLRFLQLLALC